MKTKVKVNAEFELTEENVKRLFASCVDRTKNPVNGLNLYSSETGRTPAIVYLDFYKTEAFESQIEYLFGQLKAIHDGKETFSISDGFYDYHGNVWASSSATLALLYYLGLSSSAIRPFYPRWGNVSDLVTDVSALVKPTFFPPKQEESTHV